MKKEEEEQETRFSEEIIKFRPHIVYTFFSPFIRPRRLLKGWHLFPFCPVYYYPGVFFLSQNILLTANIGCSKMVIKICLKIFCMPNGTYLYSDSNVLKYRFWVLWRSLKSQVTSVAFYSEREKSDKFCSEALISDWGSFTCRKYTTRDLRLYFPFEGSHTQDFYALKNPSTPAGFEPANLGSNGEYHNHGTTGVDRNVRI